MLVSKLMVVAQAMTLLILQYTAVGIVSMALENGGTSFAMYIVGNSSNAMMVLVKSMIELRSVLTASNRC